MIVGDRVDYCKSGWGLNGDPQLPWEDAEIYSGIFRGIINHNGRNIICQILFDSGVFRTVSMETLKYIPADKNGKKKSEDKITNIALFDKKIADLLVEWDNTKKDMLFINYVKEKNIFKNEKFEIFEKYYSSLTHEEVVDILERLSDGL